jgi:hypothetical protein
MRIDRIDGSVCVCVCRSFFTVEQTRLFSQMSTPKWQLYFCSSCLHQ